MYVYMQNKIHNIVSIYIYFEDIVYVYYKILHFTLLR